MNRHLLAGLALIAIVLALAGAPYAQAAPAFQSTSACDGGEGVYLYEHPNNQGRCIKITADVPNLSAVGFNDLASSVRIVGNWITTLFESSDYRGRSSFFSTSDANLADNTIGDNTVSSVGVQRGTRQTICDGGEGVYLYDQVNYGGSCIKLTDSVADLSTLGFNNIASSIRLIGNWTAALYVDQNFGGERSTFAQSDSDLSNNTIGDNRASSIGVSRGSSTPQENQCNGGEGVYLYEHPNYQGRCVKFTADAPDLRTLSFDDTASSIRVIGTWTATLFRDLSGTGIASVFTGDDPNIADDAIGDNQVTSIRVQRGQQSSACDGGEGVYLYEHPFYQGRCIKLTGDLLDLRVVGFDDILSSIRVVGSWTATVYRDLSGTGASSAYSSDDPNTADDAIGDNQATSVLVRRGGVPSGNICDGGEGVYLYEHPFYQGRCVKLTADAPDLRNVYFDDITSSVSIVGNWTATLYRDLSGTGASSRFTSSDPNVAGDAIGDNQATSVRVQRR